MAGSSSSTSPEREARTMSLIYFSNEFPNDDLRGLLRRLQDLSKLREYPLLANFVDAATRVLHDEIRNLSTALRSTLPVFDTIFSVADHPDPRKGPLSGSIDGILLCTLELGTYIAYAETNRATVDLASSTNSLAGLGIGLLAASALSISPKLDCLPVAAAEIIRVAFRLGTLVYEVSQDLEPTDFIETLEPWAHVVHNVTPQEAQQELDAYHAKEKTPEVSKIFLSALSAKSVTISGPPSRLQALLKSNGFFRDRRTIPLPVYAGLCHAGHIYNEQHVRDIIHPTVEALSAEYQPGLPIISTVTGQAFEASSASALIEQIISEALMQPINWDNVSQSILAEARSNTYEKCEIFAFRKSIPVHDLVSTLGSQFNDTKLKTEDLIMWLLEQPRDVGSRRSSQSKLAIVGMSCRMPNGANDTERFWQILEQGLDVHKQIPADRFDVDSHFDPNGKRVNASHTQYGCFIDEPGLFDAPFFNMSPREAEQTDPMQRLMIVTAYEALERSGFVANRTASSNAHRVGTYYGQASDDYREVNTAQEISTYFIPGGCRAFGPGRINYFLKLPGPSYSIDTACSSSLATIQMACSALWNQDVDTVIAGGVNVLTNCDAFAGLSHGHFLTKTPNACKTWDTEADGYCRADGVGSVVIKRLEDAKADNDNILGVILGAGTNHSAEAISITHPHAPSQAYLYRDLLSKAAVDPLDISLVEMHGTGTQAGDKQEMESVTEVFAPLVKRRGPNNPLHIGAVKSNVGHGEAVAGVIALLKVLLCMQKNAIPKHVGIKNSINTALTGDLDKRNVRIPWSQTPWPREPGKKRLAVVNSFSAAGGNTSLLLEEAPEPQQREADPRPGGVVALSAKSKASLRGNLERMIEYLDNNPDVLISDLAYTTTARRIHHSYRLAFWSTDLKQLRQHLDGCLDNTDTHQPISKHGPPTLAFTFTGQGSSHKSMNLELFHDCPTFRSEILHLDTLAKVQGFPSFVPAIDGSFPQDHGHPAVVSQLALVCTEIALAKYWSSLGVQPEAVMGHSLGEYAALQVARVISASDAIYLVGQRAKLLEKCTAGSHAMMAVRASVSQIEEAASGSAFEIACVNGATDTVLSGSAQEMDVVAGRMQQKGYMCKLLQTDYAFHSAQMDPILDEIEKFGEGVRFQAPSLPVISPLLGRTVFDDKTFNAKYLRRATRETVNFYSALEAAREISTVEQDTVWVEIGPHPVNVGFVKSAFGASCVTVPSLRRGENSWITVGQSAATLHTAGVPISWSEFHRPFESRLRLLDLPTYSWSNKTYWIQYNGDWSLTKGNTFYDEEKRGSKGLASPVVDARLSTTTVQQIIEADFDGSYGKVVMQSDLMQSDFLAAARGHSMNGWGVVTSSIHADIAYTLGRYLHKRLRPNEKETNMDVQDLLVEKGLVANQDLNSTKLIRVSATTKDISTGIVELEWFNVHPNGDVEDRFASAILRYGSASDWLASWAPLSHLIESRIDTLENLVETGAANRFSRSMAYTLFAKNLVNYADKYRGMQSVVLSGFEGFADVTLTTKDEGGTWTVPPHFIDSVAHLAGFIMNVTDAHDVDKNFCVTPGWKSMAFARPLTAGASYRSYVKMIPTEQDQSVYMGDVYILQDHIIVGKVGGITFRRYPRILLDRFFSPPDKAAAKSNAAPKKATTATVPSAKPESTTTKSGPTPTSQPKETAEETGEQANKTPPPPPPPGTANQPTTEATGTTGKAMALIAAETGMDPGELKDSASFADLGIDSLMSLVIAEKFRSELGLDVGGSLFLDYPSVESLKGWLDEYCN